MKRPTLLSGSAQYRTEALRSTLIISTSGKWKIMAKYSEQTQSQIETVVTTRLLAQCCPITGLPGKGAWPRGGPEARPVCYCLGVESRELIQSFYAGVEKPSIQRLLSLGSNQYI